MSVKEVLPIEFARMCAVSRSAVSKARKAARLHVTRGGKIPLDNPANRLFMDEADLRRIGEMELGHKVAPGWAALCIQLRGRDHPTHGVLPSTSRGGAIRADQFRPFRRLGL